MLVYVLKEKKKPTCTLRTKDGVTRFSKSSMGVYELRIFTIYKTRKQTDSKTSYEWNQKSWHSMARES